MSAKYDMRGVLFKNDQGNNPKRPQYRGTIAVAGVDYNLSAWIRKSEKTGDSYMSLAVEEKRAFTPKASANAVAPPKNQLTEDNWADSDTPF